MRGIRDCTGSGPTSAPPYQSALLSKIHPSLELRSYRYMDRGFNMPTNPSNACTDFRKSHFFQAWRTIAATHILDGLTDSRRPPDAQSHNGLDRGISPVSFKTTASRTLCSNDKRPPPLVIVPSIMGAAVITSNPKTHQVADQVTLSFNY